MANYVIPQMAGALAVAATRYFTETASELDKQSYDFGHAYAPKDFALERVIITSETSSGGNEREIRAEGEVLFRSVRDPSRKVRIGVGCTVRKDGDEVIGLETDILASNPDLVHQVESTLRVENEERDEWGLEACQERFKALQERWAKEGRTEEVAERIQDFADRHSGW